MRVTLWPAAFDGNSTTWVLLRRLFLCLRLLVASVAGSPAGGRVGVFLTLDLVVGWSSTSGAGIEFWCPGTLCGSPVPCTPWRLGNLRSSSFEVMDPVFLLPLLVSPSLEAPQRGPARFCG